jgi:hypothetical protein
LPKREFGRENYKTEKVSQTWPRNNHDGNLKQSICFMVRKYMIHVLNVLQLVAKLVSNMPRAISNVSKRHRTGTRICTWTAAPNNVVITRSRALGFALGHCRQPPMTLSSRPQASRTQAAAWRRRQQWEPSWMSSGFPVGDVKWRRDHGRRFTISSLSPSAIAFFLACIVLQ